MGERSEPQHGCTTIKSEMNISFPTNRPSEGIKPPDAHKSISKVSYAGNSTDVSTLSPVESGVSLPRERKSDSSNKSLVDGL